MTSPVYSKTRELVPATAATADGALPVFDPDGDPLVFAGAMQNTKIGGARFTLSSLTGITAVDVKLQHCDTPDGTYVDVGSGAFTQLTGNGSTTLDITDDTFFHRFVRAYIDVTGSGTATCQVELFFKQCGPRDRLAPPGLANKIS